MDRVAANKKSLELEFEIEGLLQELGAGLDFDGKNSGPVKNVTPHLYYMYLFRAMARGIVAASGQKVTVEELEQVEGVGPKLAQKIVDSLNQ